MKTRLKIIKVDIEFAKKKKNTLTATTKRKENKKGKRKSLCTKHEPFEDVHAG
jgi:hypothetical protein